MTKMLVSPPVRPIAVSVLLIAVLFPGLATARSTNSLVPGAATDVKSITIHMEAMPAVCAGLVCPTPVPARHPIRPHTVTLERRAWFGRFTQDINALPPWERIFNNGCNIYGTGARLYRVVFHYQEGDRWTVTIDRGPFAEMVFPNSGDPDNGGRATCVSPRTATRLNRDLDRALMPH